MLLLYTGPMQVAFVGGVGLQSYALPADNAPMVFVERPLFIRCADDLFSYEDLAQLQALLVIKTESRHE